MYNVLEITSNFSRYFFYSVPTDQQSQVQATNKSVS